ncbi:MAG: type III-A CRISPR-associated RAMP protein Csm5 [Thalassobius sp.]|nr:type III-A CRISPR-associated RAMP protein Csm5 [Thalassovita sp.]
MSYIKVEILTPVHIGSGKQLQGNFEYLYFNRKNEVAVIDDEKILSLIGDQHIEQWLRVINAEDDLLAYLENRKLNPTSENTSSKVLKVVGKAPSKIEINGKNRYPEIREFIRSGNKSPYIPGSSLKGPFRTAFLTKEILNDKSGWLNRADNFKNKKGKYSDNVLQKKFIGEDPTYDPFKLLRIGDIHFSNTVCILSESVNGKGHERFEMKDSVKQFVEALPVGSFGIGKLSVHESLKTQIVKKLGFKDKKYTQNVQKMEELALFQMVNSHTQELLKNEINLWKERELPEAASDFVLNLKKILEISEECSGNECVIRTGFGSGLKFMTGDWQQDVMSEVELDNLAKAVRRKNYGGMELPKTRRMAMAQPMGFIKLALVSEAEIESVQNEIKQKEAEKEAYEQQQKIKAEKEAEAARQAILEAEAKKQADLEAKYAKMPKPVSNDLKTGDEIEAEIYKIQTGFAMARYCPVLGEYSGQFELMASKKVKKALPDFNEKFKEGVLVKVRCEVTPKKTTFYFIEFIER